MPLVDKATMQEFGPVLRQLRSAEPLRSRTARRKLTMLRSGSIEVLYAPIHYVNETARILIVGISPGENQASIAITECSKQLREGASYEEACRAAKYAASFAGPMRANLTQMLDDLGVPAALNIETTVSLFSDHRPLLDTASVLPYPVFVDGRNYSGHVPKCEPAAPFWSYTSLFSEGLNLNRGCLVVPLGETVAEVIRSLAARGNRECFH
jgi:hypothetical protein